jgi:hypothetical protein
MVNGSWLKPELEARPQHRASEHIHVDEKPGFSGKSDKFPEVAIVMRDVSNSAQWKRSKALPGYPEVRYVQLY